MRRKNAKFSDTYPCLGGEANPSAHELTENLRKNLSVDWSERARARQVTPDGERILQKYKYPPDQQESAVKSVLQQTMVLGAHGPYSVHIVVRDE